jgi:hypothetical protein
VLPNPALKRSESKPVCVADLRSPLLPLRTPTGDPADDCASSPCQNGGSCYDGTRSYECQCAEGWTGDACEEEVPPVYLCHGDENDCDDHATCTHTGPGTHDCACFLRYGGDGQTCAEQGVAQCLPDCTLQVLCPALPPLDGATIEYSNGMISPSVATYTCDATGGAPIDGDATRTCQADGSWSGVAPTSCSPFAEQWTDSSEGITLYLTQPLRMPASSNSGSTKRQLLDWYQQQCAEGGKRAVGCNNGSYDSSDSASIGAFRMPASYGCCLYDGIESRTGWSNNFEICSNNHIVYGTSGPDATEGQMVQLVCAD